MKKFFRHLLIVFLLTLAFGILVDRAMILFFKNYHKRFVSDIKNREYQLVFLGNSRSQNHFNPKIIDENLGISSLNIGLPGATAIDIYTNLKLYFLNNKKPEIVVLNIDTFNNYKYNKPSLVNAHNFLKYKSNREYYQYFHKLFQINYLFKVDLLQFSVSKNWNYKEIIKTIFKNEDFDKKANGFYKGFQNLNKITVHRSFNSKTSTININNSYYDSIYNLCLKNNTKIFFVFSPMYRSNFTVKFKYPFIDHSKFLDSNIYFKNPNHLNLTGANIYSRMFSRYLKY
jgi:hypothetical protein